MEYRLTIASAGALGASYVNLLFPGRAPWGAGRLSPSVGALGGWRRLYFEFGGGEEVSALQRFA